MVTSTTVSDEELLAQWADGNLRAARELVERHFDGLCRFFRSKIDGEVDDLIHDVLVACMRRRETLKMRHSFRAYLYAVARHQLYAFFRERHRDGAQMDTLHSSAALLSPGPSRNLRNREERGRLLVALRSIPIDLQVAIELRYWEGMTGPELADALDIPEGTVRSRLRRALEALRTQLGGPNQTPLGELVAYTSTDFDQWAAGLETTTDAEETFEHP